MIFFFVVSIVSPNLEEYFVYFNEDVHETSPIFEGYTSIALGLSTTLLVMFWNVYLLKDATYGPLKIIVLVASFFRVLSSSVGILQTKNYNIKYKVWIII